MDLRESHSGNFSRHPWELARIKALRRIFAVHAGWIDERRVLDLGCGDGFLIDAICPDPAGLIDAVDIHLTAEQVSTFSAAKPRVVFHNSYQSLPGKVYDVITMMDVLEHVDDDVGFLQETIARYARPGARFFCTVPAFQTLFSAHDTFLCHHRRYSLAEFETVLQRSGLTVVRSGYLFGLLLPIRMVEVLVERVLGAKNKTPGIGHWCHGPLLTSLFTTVLDVDNLSLEFLSRLGLKLPGLTVWAVCETQR